MAGGVQLNRKGGRHPLTMAPAPASYNARQVRARAAGLVERHLLRLGFDSFATMALKRAIEAIPAEGDA